MKLEKSKEQLTYKKQKLQLKNNEKIKDKIRG